MYYVYLLRSLKNRSKTYVGYTTNIKQRLETHNSGGSLHTSIDRPWVLVAFLAFDSQAKALAFEKYIKVGSGHAFAKKHFWQPFLLLLRLASQFFFISALLYYKDFCRNTLVTYRDTI